MLADDLARDVMGTWAETQEAEKLLGRKPEGTLEQSAARTSSWYQETRERPGTEAPGL